MIMVFIEKGILILIPGIEGFDNGRKKLYLCFQRERGGGGQ